MCSAAVLDDSGKDALKRYLHSGGNLIGIHSASYCMRETPFFVEALGMIKVFKKKKIFEYALTCLGAAFDYHPPLQTAVCNELIFELTEF